MTRFCYIFFAIYYLLITACSTGRSYVYDIRLQKPVESKEMIFENDTMLISFKFNSKYIEFELYNKLNDGIRINWDEISVSRNGIAKRIVHYETGISKINDAQPPTSIPPKSKLKDAFILSDRITYTYVSGNRVLNIPDLYPVRDYGNKNTRKYIESLKGQMVSIYFPYYLKGEYFSKNFEFFIKDISIK